MEPQAPRQKHWLVYWWPMFAIFGCAGILFVVVGVQGQIDQRTIDAAHDRAIVHARDVPVGARRLQDAQRLMFGPDEMRDRRIAALMGSLASQCAEGPIEVADLTVETQRRLSVAGIDADAVTIIEAIQRAGIGRWSGWSYAAACASFIDNGAKGGLAFAIAETPKNIVHLRR